MKRYPVGTSVTLRDPVALVASICRAFNGELRGAGQTIIPRQILDTPGVIAIAPVGRGRHADARYCVTWTEVRSGEGFDYSLWLNHDQIRPGIKGELRP